jgi:hypothetical protein
MVLLVLVVCCCSGDNGYDATGTPSVSVAISFLQNSYYLRGTSHELG